MRRQALKILSSVVVLFAVVMLASCGPSSVGTIPNGTPDTGNGTPAVIPTVGVTATQFPTAPASTLGAAYAFVRANQLWVAQRRASPTQATTFTYTNLPDVSWHVPVWSPGDGYLAFIMNARPAGQGGGGCPAPDYSANGALYVLNTSNLRLTQLMVPADSGDALASSPLNGYWQYTFWQDATHLLAWYNGVIGKTSTTAGLYRFDLKTGTLSRVLSTNALGVTTLFDATGSMPLLLSMRYSSGQLYYQVVEHPFSATSQFVLYRRSIDHPESASASVFTMGSEAWCAAAQSGLYVMPGWDISPDGAQLAMQVVSASDSNQESSIQVLSLSDHLTTPLLTQLPAVLLAQDVMLTWGPDNQTVVVTQPHLSNQAGPFSATLANPVVMQAYLPGAAGVVAWRPDSAAFALQSGDPSVAGGQSNVYVFQPGTTQGQLLLTNVREFVWG